MQLRKVCNHPNLFETRPIISPFRVAESYLTYSLPRLLVSMSHPFLVFAPSSNGSRSVFGSASAFSDPDLDWLDTAGLVARLLGQTMNLVEMARDLPGFVARRCHQLCARENLITIIDSSDVIDDGESYVLIDAFYSLMYNLCKISARLEINGHFICKLFITLIFLSNHLPQ